MGRMKPLDPHATDHDSAGEDATPEPLLRALRALAPPAVGSDPGSFLAEARRHFAAVRHRRRRMALAACSSAAALLLLAFAGWQWQASSRPEEDLSVASRSGPLVGDLDRNNRIDILDAFALARALDRGEAPGPGSASADLSGDGRVDRADVEALARRAVALDRRVGR